MRTKCVAAMLGAFLCASMSITPVTAEAVKLEAGTEGMGQFCSDGYMMSVFEGSDIVEASGNKRRIYKDIVGYEAELTDNGVFTIKFIAMNEGFTVPFNDGISSDGSSLITLGSVAVNTDCKVEVSTPSETTEVTGNFYKDTLWNSWSVDARSEYFTISLFDKAYPIAITPNNKNSEYMNDDGTLKAGAVLAEIKVYDYKYGTPVFVNEMAFSAATAKDYKEYYTEGTCKGFIEEANDDDVLIDTSASPGCLKNAFPWYTEAVAQIPEGDDGISVQILVDGKGNADTYLDNDLYIQEVNEKQSNGEEAYCETFFVSPDLQYMNDYFIVLDADDTYNALTYSADPIDYNRYVGQYPSDLGLRTEKYRAGSELVDVGDFYYDMHFTSYASVEIEVCANTDMNFTEDTSLDLGSILVVSEISKKNVKFMSDKNCFEIKAGSSYKKGDAIGTILLSPTDEFGVNPYPMRDEIYYYIGGKMLTTYFTTDGRVNAIQRAIGDADNSGSVNIIDVIQTNKFLLGMGNVKETKSADVDGNGVVDSTDALNILKIALDMLNPTEINQLRIK